MVTWRVPLAVAVVLVALAGAGYALFPRQAAKTCCLVALPDKEPSNAAWVWRDGAPGWKPGETIGDDNVSGVQRVELEQARLAAARSQLDADGVRVLQTMRTPRSALSILATPALGYAKGAPVCLGAMLTATTVWACPAQLRSAHVLVAAAHVGGMLTLVGVARGDVTRVVLTHVSPGLSLLYQRSKTWGQFGIGMRIPRSSELVAYVGTRAVERIPLDLAAGEERVLR